MFCLSGPAPVVSCEVFPSYDVSEGDWEMGLIDLTTYNSIPNIEKDVNNKLYYGVNKVITIPEGSYEIDDIETYINGKVGTEVGFSLRPNNNTLKAEIKCTESIDFTKSDSFAALLGFSPKILEANRLYSSDNPVNIVKVNTIRVECNIVRGSYQNGNETHIIHEFYPTVGPGYKIVEIPSTIIYLPLNVRTIHNITVSLKDQEGNLINFRNEIVSLRVHVRRAHGSGI